MTFKLCNTGDVYIFEKSVASFAEDSEDSSTVASIEDAKAFIFRIADVICLRPTSRQSVKGVFSIAKDFRHLIHAYRREDHSPLYWTIVAGSSDTRNIVLEELLWIPLNEATRLNAYSACIVLNNKEATSDAQAVMQVIRGAPGARPWSVMRGFEAIERGLKGDCVLRVKEEGNKRFQMVWRIPDFVKRMDIHPEDRAVATEFMAAGHIWSLSLTQLAHVTRYNDSLFDDEYFNPGMFVAALVTVESELKSSPARAKATIKLSGGAPFAVCKAEALIIPCPDFDARALPVRGHQDGSFVKALFGGDYFMRRNSVAGGVALGVFNEKRLGIVCRRDLRDLSSFVDKTGALIVEVDAKVVETA